jgi:multiple sugar transport system permease protein
VSRRHVLAAAGAAVAGAALLSGCATTALKFFDAIPREYEEAAEIDGASRLRVFLTIVVPMSLPVLSATFQLQYAQVMALALLGGLPLLVVYVLFQRQVIRGVGSADLKE